nr:MAG TPA: hypothetical protein [Caudoviricetes sp.]DAL08462.1 MAG TPA_asm: hypothetical protein [Caudoviricetes sp.]
MLYILTTVNSYNIAQYLVNLRLTNSETSRI